MRALHQRISILAGRELPDGERCDRAIEARFRALRHLEAEAARVGDTEQAERAALWGEFYATLAGLDVMSGPEPARITILVL